MSAPVHLHKALNLWYSRSGFLFVHDASNPELEDSIRCLHNHIELQLHYGGKGFWIAISSPPGVNIPGRSAGLATRFELELSKYSELKDVPDGLGGFGRRILEMPVEDACRVAGEAMLIIPRVFERGIVGPSETPKELSDSVSCQESSCESVTSWGHKDYLRAAYHMLLKPENEGLGLLDVATKFAMHVKKIKQENPGLQIRLKSR